MKALTAAALLALAAPAYAHVTLETSEAVPGATYKAVLRVPHGCAGEATQKVRVKIPEGMFNAKPMPKAGWTLETVTGPYDRSYDSYGTPVSEGVTEIVWTGELPDAFYDEFVFRGQIAADLKPGDVLWFPVVQECASGADRWIEIPADGQDPEKLEVSSARADPDRGRRRALMLRVAALLLALVVAPAAWAHAQLVGTDPSAGSVLPEAPAAVRLSFDEPVAPIVLSWVLADARQLAATARVEGADLVVTVPDDLGRGSHLLSWRVVSVDGHPVGGTLGFAVGAPSAAPAPVASGGAALPAAAARFFLVLSLALGVGGTVFARLVDRDGSAPAWTRRLARAASLTVLPAAALALGTQGLDLLAAPWSALVGPEPWRTMLGGRAGVAAGLAALAGLLALTRGRPAAMAAWALGALSFAVAGHAATARPVVVTAPAMALHALAIIYWVGALPPLAAAAAAGVPGLGRLLRRFSAGAVPLVIGLVASGGIVATVQLGSAAALPSTAYGRLLTAKLALVAVLLGLAAVNRLRLTPAVATGRPGAGRRLARVAGAEIVVAVTVLALAAGFRLTPPPRALAAAEAPVAVHLHGPTAVADMTVRPGRAGPNAVEIAIFSGDFAPLRPREVSVGFAMPERGIEPVTLEATVGKDGTWRAGPISLPLAGSWEVTLRLLIDDFESRSIGGEMTLAP